MPEPPASKRVPILAALAQVTRLQILDRLAIAGPVGLAAGEIARSIRCPSSTLSFHLKELTRTGVLEARAQGRFVIYALRRAVLRDLAFYVAGLAGAPRQGRRRKGDGSRSPQAGRPADASQLSMFGE